jgi:chromosome segregation ATPase
VTVEDIRVIKNELESAKIEEMKVLELHSKLEAEILKLIEKVEALEENRSKVASELKLASRERERLQSKLNSILDNNMKLNTRLQSMEELEDEKRLDDVLDGMQAKMRALRLKSVKKGKDPR